MSRRLSLFGTAAVLSLGAVLVVTPAVADSAADGGNAAGAATAGTSASAAPARSTLTVHKRRRIRRSVHHTRTAASLQPHASGASPAPGSPASTSAPASAMTADAHLVPVENRSQDWSAPVKPITVSVNGEAVSDLDQAPVIRSGLMLIPLNGILDRMAATVAWQPLTHTADIQRGATHVQLVAGSTQALVNGVEQEMEIAPQVVNGTLMVPLQFVAEVLGLHSTWNRSSRRLEITSTSPAGTAGAHTIHGAAGHAPVSRSTAGSIPRSTSQSTTGAPPAASGSNPAAGSSSPDGASSGPGVTAATSLPAVTPTTDGAAAASAAPAGQIPVAVSGSDGSTSAGGAAAIPGASAPGVPGTNVPGAAVPETTGPGATPPVPGASGLPPVLPTTSGGTGTVGEPGSTSALPPALPGPAGGAIGGLAAGSSTADLVHGTVSEVGKSPEGDTLTMEGQPAADGAGKDTRYTISPGAIVLGKEASRLTRQELQFSDVEPGDEVTLHLDARGQVSALETLYRTESDRVQAVAGDRLLLASGSVLTVAPRVTVITPTGERGRLSDLRSGQMALLRINPVTGLVWRIDARPGGGGEILAGAVRIESIAAEKPGPYHAGESLVVTMKGTPGGTGAFTVSGVPGSIPMKEYEPGIYKGAMVIPPGLSVMAGPVVGHLDHGLEGSAVPVQSQEAVTLDSAPPTVDQMAPATNSTVTNHQSAIYAVFNDHDGTGVDPTTIHVRLNGADVTDKAQITDRFVTLNGLTLPDGRNSVVVSAHDKAGNYATVPWQFTVTSLASPIHKVSFSRSGGRGGETIKVTIEGVAGGEASFDLGQDRQNQPMKEVRPGHYEGSVKLEQGDQLVDIPVTGRLTIGNDTAVQLSSETVTHLDGRPGVPVIEGPANGGEISPPLVVYGHADPGSRVHVTVQYNNRVMGVFGLRGFSSEGDATADENGNWRTGALTLGTIVPRQHHTTYKIICEAINPAGAASKKAEITVYRDPQ